MSKELETLVEKLENTLTSYILDNVMLENEQLVLTKDNTLTLIRKIKAIKQSLQPNNEYDVLMNNVIDEMTKEQQLEYYKEYYNLSRQQVADETHLESSRLRDEIIKDLNEYDTYKVLGYKSHYSETDRHFYVMSDNDKACGFGIVDGKLFLSHLIPLPLASKIIKYFELESE